MSTIVKVKSLHPHFTDSCRFVLVAERDHTQYIIDTGILGIPSLVAKAEGLVWVPHRHSGYGSYYLAPKADLIGKHTPRLDPICEAVLDKGWSLSLIRMDILPLVSSSWPPTYTRERIPLRSTYTGGTEQYMIVDPAAEGPGKRHTWGISVHLADHGHICVHVGVPDVYQEHHLKKLLRAIASLPHISEMGDVHPAQRASV